VGAVTRTPAVPIAAGGGDRAAMEDPRRRRF